MVFFFFFPVCGRLSGIMLLSTKFLCSEENPKTKSLMFFSNCVLIRIGLNGENRVRMRKGHSHKCSFKTITQTRRATCSWEIREHSARQFTTARCCCRGCANVQEKIQWKCWQPLNWQRAGSSMQAETQTSGVAWKLCAGRSAACPEEEQCEAVVLLLRRGKSPWHRTYFNFLKVELKELQLPEQAWAEGFILHIRRVDFYSCVFSSSCLGKKLHMYQILHIIPT